MRDKYGASGVVSVNN